MLTPEKIWNAMSIAERSAAIAKITEETGLTIGPSNARQRYSGISKVLRDHLEKPVTRTKSEPKAAKKVEMPTLEEVKSAVLGSSAEGLDLLISFDDTGSMSSVRKQVRQKVNELVSQLFSSIPKLRVGIIIHNDYCDAPRHIFVQDFTRDKSELNRFVNQDSPCGGGDSPECYELALKTATELSWKADKRAFIVIGDALPHNPGYRCHGRDRKEYHNLIDWKAEAQKLGEMGVQIYAVQALGSRSSTSFYEGLARYTKGVKLDLSQFQHITQYINAVAYHQQGTLESYEKSDPSFSTNLSLKNMFRKLRGIGEEKGFSEKVEILSRFQVMDVDTDGETTIQEFVNSHGCTYRKGRGFYQLIERTRDGKANFEEVQANKEVLFIDKATGEAVTDTAWCRKQLGVPYGTKGTVRPLAIPAIMKKYDVFIQSNSYTRKLDPSTKFLYELERV